MTESENVKIISLQMGSYYDYINRNRIKLDMGRATLDYSLFTEFMFENGMKVNKRGKSYDFIMCKFDYGTNDLTGDDIRDKYYTTGFSVDWDKYYSDLEINRIKQIKDNKERKTELDKFITRKNKCKNSETIKYKMLMRSMGKAKDGDCLFINEKLYKKAHKYISMGIKLQEKNPKLVEMSAYNTLTCANMINSIKIPLKNILILKDQEVSTYINAVKVKTKKVLKSNEKTDYKAMESQANELGYTFYKRNEKVENKYNYIESRKKEDIEAIGIKYKESSHLGTIKSLDFKAMELEANELGYSFYKDKNQYVYVEDRKINNLKSLGIPIIKKEYETEIKSIDLKAMEEDANKIGYTFYKRESNKDGYELIPKNELIAADKDIEIKTVLVDEPVECQECYVERSEEEVLVKNVMWDGMGLIDHSIMPDDCSGFVYLRNHMTKVCCFDGEVIQFLKDYYGDNYETATRKDYFNNDINIRDIRLIITDKAIKWTKFDNVTYDNFNKELAKYDYKFSVVKTAHKSKYGDLQRSSYQGNNSLPCMDKDDLTKIAETSINYFNKLKTNDAEFLKFLKITANNYNINNFLVDLAKKYPKIMKTDYFSTERNAILSKFKRERLQLGKLMQYGDNLTIAGNVYALLLYAAEKDWRKDPTLKVIKDGIQCYTTRFKDNTELAGYRSPHNSPNNYGYYVNHYSDEMKKYFPNLGDNVICINMIGTDNQQRLNGHDMDTDGIYCTNQPEIVKCAKICYKDYPTIINEIPQITELTDEERKRFEEDNEFEPYTNSLKDYARMDNNIAKYQCGIGWSSNVAQLALSYYWDELARSDNGEKNIELEDVYIICSCLAQCYIDSAKRQFALDLNKEMLRLSHLTCMSRKEKYPRFLARIKENKIAIKKDDSNKKKLDKAKAIAKLRESTIKDCKCPMDMLSDIIESGVIDNRGKNKKGLLKIEDFLPKKKELIVKDRKRVLNVEKIIQKYDEDMQKLNIETDNYKEYALDLTDEVMNKLDGRNIPKEEIYKLVRIAFGLDKSKYNKHICNRILIILYNYDSETLINLFNNFHKKSLETA